MVSASFGILGAIYQILPIHMVVQRRSALSGERQRKIIKLLAIADLFACLGIIVRSVLWISFKEYTNKYQNYSIYCALISVWITYFYTSTYMWTMCYAIDVYFTVKERPWKFRYYHIISWLLSLFYVAAEFIILYVPEFKCHSNWILVLTHYILTFLSVFIPMLVNPILYALASNQVRQMLQGHLGRYTDQERELIKRLDFKFSSIVVVFYVCWLPNIISSLAIWITWKDFPTSFIIGLWYFMAIVNPLQAVLNSVVFRGWSNCTNVKTLIVNMFKSRVALGVIPEESTESEKCEEGNERELLLNTA